MSGTLPQAEALRLVLEAAAGDTVDTVTLDGTGIHASTRAAIVLFPPTVTYPNWQEQEFEFRAAIVAGPADRPLHAWTALDRVLTALQAARINLAKAEPATFDLAGAGSLPAYEITLNPF